MAIKLYKSQVNITNQSSTVPTAKLDPNFGQEIFQGQQALLGVVNDIENKHRRIQEENELIKAQTDYTDGYDENDGLYEIVRKNSESNNLDESMVGYDSQTESWKNTILGNIKNKNVKRKFDAWAMQTNSKYGLNVSQTVRGNNRAMLEENIQLDTNRLINEYVIASNDIVKQDAYNQLFGNEELGILGMYDRLDEVFETPIGTNKEQYNQIIQNQLSLDEAGFLAENNPNQFLAKQQNGDFNNIETKKLLQFTAAAETKATENKINYLLDHLPLDPDADMDEVETAYNNMFDGIFTNADNIEDKNKQQIYNQLSTEEKTLYEQSLFNRHKQVQANITTNRSNKIYRENEANESFYSDSINNLMVDTSDKLTIDKINGLRWYGIEGQRLKEQLIETVVKRENGEIATDKNMSDYKEIFNKVINKQILSPTIPFTLSQENQSDAKSLLQRLGGQNGIGFNQFNVLTQKIKNLNKPDVIANEKLLQDFFTAYTPQVTGAKWFQEANVETPLRIFDFEQIMRKRYEQGIATGKTPASLISQFSADFIGKDLNTFIPSNNLLMKEMADGLQLEKPLENQDEWLKQSPTVNDQVLKDKYNNGEKLTREMLEKTTEYKNWFLKKPKK
tara:strand:+ start:442 stop:2304 length:1863 start_codon:yes stop_codon:yes gene_type:complete